MCTTRVLECRQRQKNDVTSSGLKWEGRERCGLTRYADLLDAFIAVVVDENVDRNRLAVIVFLKTKTRKQSSLPFLPVITSLTTYVYCS